MVSIQERDMGGVCICVLLLLTATLLADQAYTFILSMVGSILWSYIVIKLGPPILMITHNPPTFQLSIVHRLAVLQQIPQLCSAYDECSPES
jgi:hypothetical protein